MGLWFAFILPTKLSGTRQGAVFTAVFERGGTDAVENGYY